MDPTTMAYARGVPPNAAPRPTGIPGQMPGGVFAGADATYGARAPVGANNSYAPYQRLPPNMHAMHPGQHPGMHQMHRVPQPGPAPHAMPRPVSHAAPHAAPSGGPHDIVQRIPSGVVPMARHAAASHGAFQNPQFHGPAHAPAHAPVPGAAHVAAHVAPAAAHAPPPAQNPLAAARKANTVATLEAIHSVAPPAVAAVPVNRPTMMLSGLPHLPGGDINDSIEYDSKRGVQVVDEYTSQQSAASFSSFLNAKRRRRQQLWKLYWPNRLPLNRKILVAENQCFKEAREESAELEDSDVEEPVRRPRHVAVPYIYHNRGSFDIPKPPPVAMPDPDIFHARHPYTAELPRASADPRSLPQRKLPAAFRGPGDKKFDVPVGTRKEGPIAVVHQPIKDTLVQPKRYAPAPIYRPGPYQQRTYRPGTQFREEQSARQRAAQMVRRP